MDAGRVLRSGRGEAYVLPWGAVRRKKLAGLSELVVVVLAGTRGAVNQPNQRTALRMAGRSRSI